MLCALADRNALQKKNQITLAEQKTRRSSLKKNYNRKKKHCSEERISLHMIFILSRQASCVTISLGMI